MLLVEAVKLVVEHARSDVTVEDVLNSPSFPKCVQCGKPGYHTYVNSDDDWGWYCEDHYKLHVERF